MESSTLFSPTNITGNFSTTVAPTNGTRKYTTTGVRYVVNFECVVHLIETGIVRVHTKHVLLNSSENLMFNCN